MTAVVGPSATCPASMTADERMAEVSRILARGLTRLLGRKSSCLSAECRDSFVDSSPNRSSHGIPNTAREA
jgi:hypothetical protein